MNLCIVDVFFQLLGFIVIIFFLFFSSSCLQCR